MDLYRITASVIFYFGLSAASEPDWSCDFEVDDCGFIDTEREWTRTLLDGNYALQADVTEDTVVGDMFIISIPYDFNSATGNVSFHYFVRGGDFQVTVCQDQSEAPVRARVPSTGQVEVTPTLRYSCASEMNVEIRFSATALGGDVTSVIRLDDIQIFEAPYTEVPTSGSSHTNAMPTKPTSHMTRVKETDVPLATGLPQLSWPIPVAATMSCLFVVTFIVLVVLIFCYRKSLNEHSSSGLQSIASQNHPSAAAVPSKSGESDDTHPSVEVRSPKHGVEVTSDTIKYTGLINPDKPQPYTELFAKESGIFSYSEECYETDEHGYEIPVAAAMNEARRHIYSNCGGNFNSHWDYDDAMSAPAV